jgi:hypothetical protein
MLSRRHSGLRGVVTLLSLTLVGGLACGDHLLELDEDFQADEPETLPVCLVLAGTTLGYWQNGDSSTVWDLEQTAAVCTCMTPEQMESGELDGVLNDRMLVECERVSALRGFDWDECEEDHASGVWFQLTFDCSPGKYFNFLVPDDLVCE